MTATREQRRIDAAWRTYGMAVWAHLRAHDTLATALDAAGRARDDLPWLVRARRRA